MRRSNGYSGKIDRREQRIHGHKALRNRQWSGTGQIRRHHNGGQWGAGCAAIRLRGPVLLRCPLATPMCRLVRLLQADFTRRNQGAHQNDGDRRALKHATQHGFERNTKTDQKCDVNHDSRL